MKLALADILKDNGYITDYEKIDDQVQGTIRITLRYYQRESAIKAIKRISKPGCRVYKSVEDIPRVNNGMGISIISTSRGVLSDKKARQINVGGEVLCTIW